MNTLTKISVVILVLLIVVFCPVLITAATMQPIWRARFDTEQRKNEALTQDKVLTTVALQKAQGERDLEKGRADGLRGQLTNETGKLQRDLDAATARYAVLNGNYTAMSTSLQELRSDAAAKEARNVDLVKQLNDARTEKNALAEEKRKSDDEVRRMTLISDRQEKQIESLQQQIGDKDQLVTELQRQIASGGGRGSTGGVIAAPPVPPEGIDITGKITTLDKGIAGINVGSAQGVQKKMVAMVYSGKEYVGEIQIEEVDVSSAAGVFVRKARDAKVGDSILIQGKR